MAARSESIETMTIRGACPHDCPDTCATLSTVENGRITSFTADPNHPVTDGWLCAKVRPYLDRVYAPDRLLHPLRRVGPKGSDQWETITWDEALGETAYRWQEIISHSGSEAILPYSYSGTLGLVEMGVASSRFWNRLGASGLERSICDAAATAAVIATIGAKWAPDPRDVLQSKLLIIWGHNPASTAPHFMPILREAQRKGTQIVVIDPRRTRTARSADLHLQPNPATDGALALGMAHVLFAENLVDQSWLEKHTIGWEGLRDRVADYAPDQVSGITGIDAEAIISLARQYASGRPAMIKIADGVQRHGGGGQAVRSILTLPALTGQYGVRGGGLFYSQSGHIVWNGDAVGHASDCAPPKRVVNMNRLGAALLGEVSDPPIESLYVFGANPVASTPNASAIVAGMMRDDLFTVVHEQFMTDTARLADIVLPATTQVEHLDLHKPYGHRHLLLNEPAISPRGEARSNWTVMQNLATAMGFNESWLHEDSETVIRSVLDTTRAENPYLADITYERLQSEGSIAYATGTDQQVPFADHRFPTPSGKVEIASETLAGQGAELLPSYLEPEEFAGWNREDDQLMLLSGAAHHFVSSSMANQPALLAKEGQPALYLHPADATRFRLIDGEWSRVFNSRGECQLVVHVTTDVKPGVAVAPKGHWPSNSPDRRNVNWLTSDALADLGNQATFHSTLIRIEPVTS